MRNLLTPAIATSLLALTLTPAVAAPAAPAAPAEQQAAAATRYLYMVRDIETVGDIHTGAIAVLRKRGHKVKGVSGYLYSESRCLRGRVAHHRLVGEYPAFDYGGTVIPAEPLDVRWRGHDAKQRMGGWHSITAKRAKHLSGGGVRKSLIRRVCSSTL